MTLMYITISRNSKFSVPTQFSYIYISKCRTHLCGYDLNLTYPQHGHFPSLRDPGDIGSSVVPAQARSVSRSKALLRNAILAIDSDSDGQFIHKRELEVREEKRQLWKRDLSGRPNGTIDPSYGCYLIYEVEDYAMNYSAPWSMYLSQRSIQVLTGHHVDISLGFDVRLFSMPSSTILKHISLVL